MATNSSNFMYASSQKPSSGQKITPGGYPVGAGDTDSPTGLWRTKVPFLPAPVPNSEMRKGREAAKYTYRNYAVPEFDSDLVGMPAGSFPMINGENGTKDIQALGNTTIALDSFSSWPAKQIKEVQAVGVKMGWLPQNAANGRPNKQTVSMVAFLMDQGNRIGVPWKDVLKEGPEWLRRVGGADVVNGSGDGGGSGSGYQGPITSVSKSVNYTSRAGARNLLRQTLSDILGRGPEDSEVDEFLDLLRSKEKKNPTVTTTISDQAPDGSSNTSSSTTEGGFDQEQAGALAERFAQNIDPQQASRYKRAGYEQLLDSLIMGG